MSKYHIQKDPRDTSERRLAFCGKWIRWEVFIRDSELNEHMNGPGLPHIGGNVCSQCSMAALQYDKPGGWRVVRADAAP